MIKNFKLGVFGGQEAVELSIGASHTIACLSSCPSCCGNRLRFASKRRLCRVRLSGGGYGASDW
jgi:hypothetical protein